MSSDLIEDVEDNCGSAVFLEYYPTGHARLSIFDEVTDHEANFNLTPDDEGLKLAEKIESGLRAWRKQVEHLRRSGITPSA